MPLYFFYNLAVPVQNNNFCTGFKQCVGNSASESSKSNNAIAAIISSVFCKINFAKPNLHFLLCGMLQNILLQAESILKKTFVLYLHF